MYWKIAYVLRGSLCTKSGIYTGREYVELRVAYALGGSI